MPRIQPDGRVLTGPINIETAVQPIGQRRLQNWLAGFLDYTDQLESPVNFLRWAGLATIAGAAQRKLYMDMEYFVVYSNMYVVLVGPAGIKKSVAIRQGKKMLAKVPGMNLSADAPSVVGLMDDFKDIQIASHQSLNAFILELSSLYENAEKTMVGFLTTIYDCDPDYIKRSRVGGKEVIPYPWLNLLAGTTPAWLGESLSKQSIEGGLVARTIFVYSDEEIFKTPRPVKGPKYDKLKEDLVHDLAHISQLSGEFHFEGGRDGEAGKWYDEWYLNPARIPKPRDNRTTGYYSRKPIHLLKVAMAVALSKSDKLILTLEDLQVAKALLEEIEPGMKKAFSSVGGNDYATDLERIELQIQQAGKAGLSYREILRNNVHNVEKRMLDAILESLYAMGAVNKKIDVKNGEWVYVSLET